MQVFLDSDVVISSLISKTGVAYLLVNNKNIVSIVSSISVKELRIVVERLGIDKQELQNLLKKRFRVVVLKESPKKIKIVFGRYVTDENDSHIIAGARSSKAKFLITYNVRHYKVDKIKEDFGVNILTPARFLQYLRSL